MLGNLTIDKASMNISYFLYTIKIINDNNGKITRTDFVNTMADFIGVPPKKSGKENRTPYNKSKLPRYFGFVDLDKDEDGNSILILTQRGKRLAEIISEHTDETDSKTKYYIKKENQSVFTNMFLESVLFDTFGKNNCGAEQSNTDVEPPKVVFKTISLLEKVTAAEIVYIMFGLNRGHFSSYDEALASVQEKRSISSYDYSSILDEWGLTNIADDCKIINIFTDESIKLLISEKDDEAGKTFYRLNKETTNHLITEIKNLCPIYNSLQMSFACTDYETVCKWLDDTILGRISNADFVVKSNASDFSTEEEFQGEVLSKALAKAFNNPKNNIYMIVKNTSPENMADLLGEAAPLLVRKDELAADDHCWSAEVLSLPELYNKVTSLSATAKRILPLNKVQFPSNFHIITIESENIDMNQNYDFTFKKGLIETEQPSSTESIPDDENLFHQRVPRTTKKPSLNMILYGAPGTGKTYATAEYALSIVTNQKLEDVRKLDRKDVMHQYNQLVKDGRVVFTTFHQSYGYEEFVQGLRPDSESDVLSFVPVDGVFKRIADKAMMDDKNAYLIIIDEINRANISKVFGELITLIENDKRWGEVNAISVTLPSGCPFAIPNNLYILGTMNSADKSISLIDTALRRRFDFVEVTPNAEMVTDSTLKSVLIGLNQGLYRELESTDLLIGHSYFIGKTVDDLCDILNNNIVPLLYEYFYDNRKKVENLLKEVLNDLPVAISSNTVGRLKIINKSDENA